MPLKRLRISFFLTFPLHLCDPCRCGTFRCVFVCKHVNTHYNCLYNTLQTFVSTNFCLKITEIPSDQTLLTHLQFTDKRTERKYYKASICETTHVRRINIKRTTGDGSSLQSMTIRTQCHQWTVRVGKCYKTSPTFIQTFSFDCSYLFANGFPDKACRILGNT